jgi:hypothetical protein
MMYSPVSGSFVRPIVLISLEPSLKALNGSMLQVVFEIGTSQSTSRAPEGLLHEDLDEE